MSSGTQTPETSACSPIDLTSINTIRTLAMDGVQAANSGHPGTPMAMAPVAYCLWQQFLRFDLQDPVWPNRDRFVPSAGHASMLLYALLHSTEGRAVSKDYEALGEPSVPLDALKSFRQLDSRCPGHPEYRWTSGVETTTGPLGQDVGRDEQGCKIRRGALRRKGEVGRKVAAKRAPGRKWRISEASYREAVFKENATCWSEYTDGYAVSNRGLGFRDGRLWLPERNRLHSENRRIFAGLALRDRVAPSS